MSALPSTPLPSTIEEISPAWIQAILSARFPGVAIDGARLTKFIDGTAQKMRYELDYKPGGRPEGAPASLWIKGGFDPKGATQGDAFANEVRFFRDIAPQLAINLPDCYFGEVDAATNNGVVALEDLIARGAGFGRATTPLSADQCAQVLSLQARLHGRFWGGRGVEALGWLKPGGAIAGAGAVDQYFGFWDDAMPRPRFAFLTSEQRDRERMQGALNRLIEDLRDRPMCVLHGDSQHGNLFFDPDDRPGYLDWQHVMLGVWAFDLSGFLVAALTIADRRTHERDLLAHYLTELAAAGGVTPAFETAWEDYARYAMWAFMWAMCPIEAHPEDVCSFNTERACAAIDDLGSLRLLGA